jgi:hypothetical protein
VERPLKLGELLAETVRIYGERFWAAVGVGAVVAGATVVAGIHPVVEVVVLALAFTGAYAAAVRLAAGDSFTEAWAQVGVRVPILVLLTFFVALPFALALGLPLLIIIAVAWLAFVGFSVPVAMLEESEATGRVARVGYVLNRTIALARAEYLHAAGVVAALVILYIACSFVLGVALIGFADAGPVAVKALIQLVLAPFFFLGLSVLYFEQRARAALSSPSQRARRRGCRSI